MVDIQYLVWIFLCHCGASPCTSDTGWMGREQRCHCWLQKKSCWTTELWISNNPVFDINTWVICSNLCQQSVGLSPLFRLFAFGQFSSTTCRWLLHIVTRKKQTQTFTSDDARCYSVRLLKNLEPVCARSAATYIPTKGLMWNHLPLVVMGWCEMACWKRRVYWATLEYLWYCIVIICYIDLYCVFFDIIGYGSGIPRGPIRLVTNRGTSSVLLSFWSPATVDPWHRTSGRTKNAVISPIPLLTWPNKNMDVSMYIV